MARRSKVSEASVHQVVVMDKNLKARVTRWIKTVKDATCDEEECPTCRFEKRGAKLMEALMKELPAWRK